MKFAQLSCDKSALPMAFVLLFCIVYSVNVSAESSRSQTVIKRYDATPSQSSGLLMPGDKKLQFKFSNSELSGWVRQNGDWYIEGLISHNNFFCADYSLGMRFGEGHPGCIDVKWLTEDQYATRKKQCNNVSMNHSGYQSNSEIAGIFGKITCAQGLVKCVGTCK